MLYIGIFLFIIVGAIWGIPALNKAFGSPAPAVQQMTARPVTYQQTSNQISNQTSNQQPGLASGLLSLAMQQSANKPAIVPTSNTVKPVVKK